ncbi:MarR family transcriptional regulator [uncultured Phyllobacterium sp.]|uniref:MarR family winged helix-turn-helix transcriptional regulator n=1 Tax=uncultured Phyllobacterium sp. TaxID=253813 RepID=UPI00258AF602|nr:MarR family transcriptional regulator [uncultured Phyllobacterium sp.]
MHDTHNSDALAAALIDLVGILNSPRQDDVLLKEAGVSLDRALFPLLVRIGTAGSIGVVELAEQVGRDHSTISRQLAKLEMLGLVDRQTARGDQRINQAIITENGSQKVLAIVQARRKLLDALLSDWSSDEREAIARLNRKLADVMKAARSAKA